MLATLRPGRSCLRASYLKSRLYRYCSTTDSNPEGKSTEPTPSKTGGFARAFEKQSHILDTQENVENQTFATLLRNSKLMDVSSAYCTYFLCEYSLYCNAVTCCIFIVIYAKQKKYLNYRFHKLHFGHFSFS